MINLEKGQRIKLEKGISKVRVGLGWDVNAGAGYDYDLDASVFALTNGKLANENHLVYFGHLDEFGGGIHHTGDNLTGEGDGDDEVIQMDLAKIPESITELLVVVNIYSAHSRNQNFGQVNNAFCNVYNDSDKSVIAKYDLTEDYSGKVGIKVASIYRHDGGWKVRAIGDGSDHELGGMVEELK